MAKYESGLSNRSYTNKDFNAIYPELLDLVKKLSPKWDPTVSDESDPGNILLKLAAIVADKNNYAIDKGILEAFPVSVAQDSNARELFAQLGYFMKWYRAATGTVNLRWIGKVEEGQSIDYNIPAFTMISDLDNKYVYTITEKVSLQSSGKEVQANIIQGTFVNHSINSKELITVANLDSNNRIYLPRSNVAENGIFICNADNQAERRRNYADWRQVDNLEVESYGQYIYKFGVTADGFSCYLEFPGDAENIFADGIYISYILTDGFNGNITKKVLEQFYEDSKASFRDSEGNSDEITLTTENVALLNLDPIQNGLNPETIDQAYTNFKKTIGTFNTLVSVRDYSNAIRKSGLISNGFVTDRNNDVQSSYKIITNNNGIEERAFCVELISEKTEQQAINGEYLRMMFGYLDDAKENFYKDPDLLIKVDPDPSLIYLVFDSNTNASAAYVYKSGEGFTGLTENKYFNAEDLDEYTLKLYVLQKVDNIQNSIAYDKSFEVVPYIEDPLREGPVSDNATISNILEYISDNKCIIHDFKGQRPYKPVLFINKYPIICKVIPQYKLTNAQQDDIFANIIRTLFDRLNSKEVVFGESIEYDKVFDMIMQADERIKAIALDTLNYETYAIYYDTRKEAYQEINISNRNLYNECYVTSIPGDKPLFRVYADENHLEEITPQKDVYYLDLPTNEVYVYSPIDNACIYKCPDMRTDIFAKSVLAGVTQFLIPANNYNYSMEQHYELEAANIDRITTNAVCNVAKGLKKAGPKSVLDINTDIELDKPVIPGSLRVVLSDDSLLHDDGKGNVYKDGENVGHIDYPTGVLQVDGVTPSEGVINYENNDVVASYNESLEYPVKQNENIYLTAPSLIQKAQYSGYVKYQFQLNGTTENPKVIRSESEYQLISGESITFYWKSRDDEDAGYDYYKYGPGTIINPTFTLSSADNASEEEYYGKNLSLGKGIISSPDLNTSINQLIDSPNVLSGTRCIYIKDVNRVVINEKAKVEYCCWILNKKTIIDGQEKYELFGPNVTEYILQPNEYFIYKPDGGARLVVLGTGTKLTRNNIDSGRWTCNIIDAEVLMDTSRTAELNSIWVPTQLNTIVTATEMQYITIGAGEKIKFVNNSQNHVYYISFNNEGYDILASTQVGIITQPDPKMTLSDFRMSYTNNGNEIQVPNIYLFDENQVEQTWSGKSIYRVDVNNTQPQVLYSGQSIQYNTIDGEENIIFGNNDKPVNLLSNVDAVITGGINVPTVSTSLMNDNIYLDFYQYSSDRNIRDNISYDQNQIVTTFNRLTTEGPIKNAAFTFKLPKGDYVLPFITQASELADCKVKSILSRLKEETIQKTTTMNLSETPIVGTLMILVGNHTLLDDGCGVIYERDVMRGTINNNQIQFTSFPSDVADDANFNISYRYAVEGAQETALNCIGRELSSFITPHYYYLDFESTGEEVTLILSATYKSDIYGFKRFIFKSIYKYNHPSEDILSDREFNLVLNRMIDLDKNIKYDFTYQVPSETLIQNPLKGESFLDSNHIFNSNTICKIDVINTDLQITNKIK